MEWVAENWFFILIVVLFIGMHLTGHGCCGGHAKDGKDDKKGTDKHTVGRISEDRHGSCH